MIVSYYDSNLLYVNVGHTNKIRCRESR
jgi:hypothetical protein